MSLYLTQSTHLLASLAVIKGTRLTLIHTAFPLSVEAVHFNGECEHSIVDSVRKDGGLRAWGHLKLIKLGLMLVDTDEVVIIDGPADVQWLLSSVRTRPLTSNNTPQSFQFEPQISQ